MESRAPEWGSNRYEFDGRPGSMPLPQSKLGERLVSIRNAVATAASTMLLA
jgi:hypothetical protein